MSSPDGSLTVTVGDGEPVPVSLLRVDERLVDRAGDHQPRAAVGPLGRDGVVMVALEPT